MDSSFQATTAYPRNSPQAAGRLVALALIANGEIKASECSVLYEIQARERLGLRGEEWHDIVNDLSTDLLKSAAGGPHCRIDEPTLSHWFAEIDDPRLQSLVAQLGAAVVGADGYVDDGEAVVLRHALQHWPLPYEEQACLEQMVYGLDFQVVPRHRVAYL